MSDVTKVKTWHFEIDGDGGTVAACRQLMKIDGTESLCAYPPGVNCVQCKGTIAWQDAWNDHQKIVGGPREVYKDVVEVEVGNARRDEIKADAILEAISMANYKDGQSFVYTADLIELRARYLGRK